MVGLVLAGIYALYLWLKGRIPELIFKRAANFLFWWYVAVTCLQAILVFFLLAGAGAVAGTGTVSPLDLLIGVALGGAFGLFVAVVVIVFSSLAIVGAHLLRTSVRDTHGGFQWHKARLVVGIILLFIAVFVTVGGN